MDHSSRARLVRIPHRSRGVCPYPGQPLPADPLHARSTTRVSTTVDIPAELGTLHAGRIFTTPSHTHDVSATAERSRPIARSIPDGSDPPPCAISAFPPPRPDTAPANSGMSAPAARPLS